MDPPVRHIFHAAGVSVDMMLHEVTEQTFRDVGDCKCKAAWWLHEVSCGIYTYTYICVWYFQTFCFC